MQSAIDFTSYILGILLLIMYPNTAFDFFNSLANTWAHIQFIFGDGLGFFQMNRSENQEFSIMNWKTKSSPFFSYSNNLLIMFLKVLFLFHIILLVVVQAPNPFK